MLLSTHPRTSGELHTESSFPGLACWCSAAAGHVAFALAVFGKARKPEDRPRAAGMGRPPTLPAPRHRSTVPGRPSDQGRSLLRGHRPFPGSVGVPPPQPTPAWGTAYSGQTGRPGHSLADAARQAPLRSGSQFPVSALVISSAGRHRAVGKTASLLPPPVRHDTDGACAPSAALLEDKLSCPGGMALPAAAGT